MLARIGLAAMVIGAVLDVVVNLAAGPHAMHHRVDFAHLGHLLAIVGMVLVLAGVAIHGARRQLSRRDPAADSGGLDSNAHR